MHDYNYIFKKKIQKIANRESKMKKTRWPGVWHIKAEAKGQAHSPQSYIHLLSHLRNNWIAHSMQTKMIKFDLKEIEKQI